MNAISPNTVQNHPAETFLECLAGPSWREEKFVFQTFDDDKKRKDRNLMYQAYETWDSIKPKLEQLNQQGAGIAVAINKVHGGRQLENLDGFRAVWLDHDKPEVVLPDDTEWPLTPHIKVETSPGRYQFIWLVDGLDKVTHRRICEGIAKRYGGDLSACDAVRVLRLPGFNHNKHEPTPSLLHYAEIGESPYPATAVIQKFGIPEAVPVPAERREGKPIENLPRVLSALESIDPDIEHSKWIQIGMALHHASGGGQAGLTLWDEWSAKGAKYKKGEPAERWKSFGKRNGITVATLFKLAKPKPKSRIKSMSTVLSTEYKPLRWSIPGVLPEGLTLLAGPPKAKKSWLALGFALAVCSGGCALGTISVDQGRVLYLALEDSERRLQSRTRAMCGDTPHGLEYFDTATEWPRMDDGGLDELKAYLKENLDTRLVIVDTLALVRPRKLQGQADYDADYGAMSMLKNLADEFLVSLLVITHTRKQAADDWLDMVIGTHGVTGAADGLLTLARTRCSDEAILSITGRDIEEERELSIAWRADNCSWYTTGTDPAILKLSPESKRILEILRDVDTPLSSKQIAEQYHGRVIVDKKDRDWSATRMLLSKLLAKKYIFKLEDGTYTT